MNWLNVEMTVINKYEIRVKLEQLSNKIWNWKQNQMIRDLNSWDPSPFPHLGDKFEGESDGLSDELGVFYCTKSGVWWYYELVKMMIKKIEIVTEENLIVGRFGFYVFGKIFSSLYLVIGPKIITIFMLLILILLSFYVNKDDYLWFLSRSSC